MANFEIENEFQRGVRRALGLGVTAERMAVLMREVLGTPAEAQRAPGNFTEWKAAKMAKANDGTRVDDPEARFHAMVKAGCSDRTIKNYGDYKALRARMSPTTGAA